MNCEELMVSGLRKSRSRDGKMRVPSILFSLMFSFASVPVAQPIDYDKQIKPIFAARCKACHGVLKQEASLRLDTGALIRHGGDNGKIITPGISATSELIKRITSSEPSERMPQEGEPLTSEQVAIIREWIDQGAHSPADEKA